MTTDLYVYYKAGSYQADLLRTKVIAMQAALNARYGVNATVKRRPAEHNGLYTWMEVYQAVPPDFESALEQAAGSAGLNDLIDGPRHIEQFLDVSPCV